MFRLVGLTGPSWNSALQAYVSAGPPTLPPAPRRTPNRVHKVSRRLDANDLQRLIEAYQGGLSAAELARRHDVAKSTVLKLLREAGVTLRYSRFSAAETAQIVELYRQGVAQTEIGRLVGRHPGAVWHVLRRQGLV